jgi:hypothetical protein
MWRRLRGFPLGLCLRAIIAHLNEAGATTARGSTWTAAAVQRVLCRLACPPQVPLIWAFVQGSACLTIPAPWRAFRETY